MHRYTERVTHPQHRPSGHSAGTRGEPGCRAGLGAGVSPPPRATRPEGAAPERRKRRRASERASPPLQGWLIRGDSARTARLAGARIKGTYRRGVGGPRTVPGLPSPTPWAPWPCFRWPVLTPPPPPGRPLPPRPGLREPLPRPPWGPGPRKRRAPQRDDGARVAHGWGAAASPRPGAARRGASVVPSDPLYGSRLPAAAGHHGKRGRASPGGSRGRHWLPECGVLIGQRAARSLFFPPSSQATASRRSRGAQRRGQRALLGRRESLFLRLFPLHFQGQCHP